MICYVEDDKNIRELVVYTLAQTGFEAVGFSCCGELFDYLETAIPSLILLDIMLPDVDGIQILKRLRAERKTAELPIIMVTAKGSEFDRVTGLELGADDYISKPFGMMELVARVKALLRRTQKPHNLELSGIALDSKARRVLVDGVEVVLTFKEYELLKFLMENRGTAFSREHMLSAVWGYDYDGGTRTVDVHVQTLRQKLGDRANLIETVRGVGYRFGG